MKNCPCTIWGFCIWIIFIYYNVRKGEALYNISIMIFGINKNTNNLGPYN